MALAQSDYRILAGLTRSFSIGFRDGRVPYLLVGRQLNEYAIPLDSMERFIQKKRYGGEESFDVHALTSGIQ